MLGLYGMDEMAASGYGSADDINVVHNSTAARLFFLNIATGRTADAAN